jgi:hypoxanthine phosphoribosyltransferase
MKQEVLSWAWFDRSAMDMASRCRERFPEERGAVDKPIDGIIALGRGGMVLGTRLSHLLGVPLAGAVIMSRYNNPQDQTPDPPVDGVIVSPYVLRRRGAVLLVDNIISEGVTLRLALHALEGAGVDPRRVQVLALLARGQHAPDGIIGARNEDPDAWFVFPWEVRA